MALRVRAVKPGQEMSQIWCAVRILHLHPAQAGRLCHQELPMTGLTIRADELIMAFEDYGTELQHFFDRQTGEVLTVFEDMDEEDSRAAGR